MADNGNGVRNQNFAGYRKTFHPCGIVKRLFPAAVLAAILGGCALRPAPAPSVAVEVSRVPIEREPLPLPELPETFAPIATPAPEDTPATLATKLELAEINAKLEQVKADAAAAIYAAAQGAKQSAEQRQKETDIRLAALEEKLKNQNATENETEKQKVFAAREWLGAIIAAAIACIAYAYKRINALAAIIGLFCFAGLFCLVLAGQYYPRYLPFAPLVICPLILYIVHRAGLMRAALVACVRGVEFADDAATKSAIKTQPDAQKIEVVRREIDAATIQSAKAQKAPPGKQSPKT